MTRYITFANQKGGVGKTTMTINVGDGLARQGKSVLLVDLDPQGQVASFLGKEKSNMVFKAITAEEIDPYVLAVTPNLHVLAGGKRTTTAQTMLASEGADIAFLRWLLQQTRNSYDYILLDTSPSVGTLQQLAIWASDYLMIPCQTHKAALEGLAAIVDTATDMKNRFEWKGGIGGIIPTMYDGRTREAVLQLAAIKGAYNGTTTDVVRSNVRFSESTSFGQSIFEYANGSNDESCQRAVEDMSKIVWWVRDL